MGSEFTGVWVVATCAGKSYIGKVVAIRVGSTDNGFSRRSKTDNDGISQEDVLDADRVALSPAYDFFSPLRPIQVGPGQMGYSRDPICMPLDFTMETAKIWIQPSAVVFFSDLEKEDLDVYESFVRAADQQKVTQRAAQRSGLQLVGADGKPKHPGR